MSTQKNKKTSSSQYTESDEDSVTHPNQKLDASSRKHSKPADHVQEEIKEEKGGPSKLEMAQQLYSAATETLKMARHIRKLQKKIQRLEKKAQIPESSDSDTDQSSDSSTPPTKKKKKLRKVQSPKTDKLKGNDNASQSQETHKLTGSDIMQKLTGSDIMQKRTGSDIMQKLAGSDIMQNFEVMRNQDETADMAVTVGYGQSETSNMENSNGNSTTATVATQPFNIMREKGMEHDITPSPGPLRISSPRKTAPLTSPQPSSLPATLQAYLDRHDNQSSSSVCDTLIKTLFASYDAPVETSVIPCSPLGSQAIGTPSNDAQSQRSHDTPVQRSHDAPVQRSHDTTVKRSHDAPVQRSHDTMEQRSHDTSIQRSPDALIQRSHDAPLQRSQNAAVTPNAVKLSSNTYNSPVQMAVTSRNLPEQTPQMSPELSSTQVRSSSHFISETEYYCDKCGLMVAKAGKSIHTKNCRGVPICLYCCHEFKSIEQLNAHKPECKEKNWETHLVRRLQHEKPVSDSELITFNPPSPRKRAPARPKKKIKASPLRPSKPKSEGEGKDSGVFYVCIECGWQFTNPQELRSHRQRQGECSTNKANKHRMRGIKTHTRYCYGCKKNFASQSDYNLHVPSCDKHRPPQKSFNCFSCYKTFSTQQALTSHKNSQHLISEKNSNCWVCGEMFSNFNQMVEHVKNHEVSKSRGRNVQAGIPRNHGHLVLTRGQEDKPGDKQPISCKEFADITSFTALTEERRYNISVDTRGAVQVQQENDASDNSRKLISHPSGLVKQEAIGTNEARGSSQKQTSGQNAACGNSSFKHIEPKAITDSTNGGVDDLLKTLSSSGLSRAQVTNTLSQLGINQSVAVKAESGLSSIAQSIQKGKTTAIVVKESDLNQLNLGRNIKQSMFGNVQVLQVPASSLSSIHSSAKTTPDRKTTADDASDTSSSDVKSPIKVQLKELRKKAQLAYSRTMQDGTRSKSSTSQEEDIVPELGTENDISDEQQNYDSSSTRKNHKTKNKAKPESKVLSGTDNKRKKRLGEKGFGSSDSAATSGESSQARARKNVTPSGAEDGRAKKKMSSSGPVSVLVDDDQVKCGTCGQFMYDIKQVATHKCLNQSNAHLGSLGRVHMMSSLANQGTQEVDVEGD